MPRKKLLLVYNPFSGKGGIIRALPDIISMFTADGFDVTAHPTARTGDGCDFISEYAEEYDLICSCGGDGMLHELANGMKQHSPDKRCGYIPAGTMNDFAGSLNIPRVMTEAADMIVRGHFRCIDMGRLNDLRFAYIAAFGAFTEVSYSTDRQLKSFFGTFAYFLEGMKLFDLNYFSEKSSQLKIICGDKTFDGEFVFGMVGNTLSVAGLTKIIPKDAAMNDGLLDCLFIRRPRNLAELDAIRSAILDENRSCNGVIRLRTAHIIVESAEPLEWDLDGEYGGSIAKAEINVEKQALLLAVPENCSACID